MSKSQLKGRTLARAQAFQVLFQSEATARPVADVLSGDYTLEVGPIEPYAQTLAQGAGEMIVDLDRIIDIASNRWDVTRLTNVDRNLLRLATYEMLKQDDVDDAVCIDEAVELAKRYGTDESPRFVNGVLGRIASLIEEQDNLVAYAQEAGKRD